MKATVILVIFILLIFGFSLFWPADEINLSEKVSEKKDRQSIAAVDYSQLQETVAVVSDSASTDDEKIVRMTAKYEELEKNRKKLKRRLARIRHEIWGLEFPTEQAKEMKGILLNATKLIKNPDMLGAFSSVDGIQDEITKINFAHKTLDQVSAMIEENKKNKSG
ncbi:MAG: hypothetical protein MI865_09615 [Proteobacteria bacterium]|nr:hypothetical protein [Pseudomonadota bacterium]